MQAYRDQRPQTRSAAHSVPRAGRRARGTATCASCARRCSLRSRVRTVRGHPRPEPPHSRSMPPGRAAGPRIASRRWPARRDAGRSSRRPGRAARCAGRGSRPTGAAPRLPRLVKKRSAGWGPIGREPPPAVTCPSARLGQDVETGESWGRVTWCPASGGVPGAAIRSLAAGPTPAGPFRRPWSSAAARAAVVPSPGCSGRSASRRASVAIATSVEIGALQPVHHDRPGGDRQHGVRGLGVEEAGDAGGRPRPIATGSHISRLPKLALSCSKKISAAVTTAPTPVDDRQRTSELTTAGRRTAPLLRRVRGA